MGKISDLINRQIIAALKSSIIISPRFTDYRVADVLNLETTDIEGEIDRLLNKQNQKVDKTQETKKEAEIQDTMEVVDRFKKGNVGEIEKFTSEQFSNVRALATNPFSFVINSVFRKLGKGVGIAGIALLFMEIVKFVIEQLMQPGRALDRRFKKLIDKQILVFTERREQAELRQGFKEVRITTIAGLRGGQGQVSGNFFNREAIPPNYLDTRKLESSLAAQDSTMRKFGKQSVGARGPNSR